MPPPVRRTLDGQLADILTRLGILETRPRGGGGGSGGSTAWADITGKPSTFPASAHTHPSSQITDFATAVPAAMPAASDTVAGKVELATDLETQVGTDGARAVTPLSLNSRTATEGRTGLVELATSAETAAGSDATRAITPAGLLGRTATEDRIGLAEIATTAEATAGTDDARYITPLKLAQRIAAIPVLAAATEASAGIVELATNAEAIAGTDAARAVTPAALTAALLGRVYPVGSIFMSTVNTNPGTYLGGTWVAWGTGRVPVGVDTGQTEFNTVEKTGGAKTHTLGYKEVPVQKGVRMVWGAGNIAFNPAPGAYVGTPPGNSLGTFQNDARYDADTANNMSQGGQPHNNLQPYITCYMFKRTA